MRFVLDPGGDVEVPRGLTIAEARPALARLTGDRLAQGLWVADRRLAEDHPAGTVPWVEGSVLTIGGPGPMDPVARAALAPWHLAVVSGPDAGRVVCPDGDRAVLGDLAVVRRRTWGRRERWVVRPSGGWRRARPPTSVRAGRTIRTGGSTVVVRRIADLTAETGDRQEVSTPTPTTTTATPAIGWLVPLVVSAGLALATRNPVYLLFALGGPLGSVAPRLLRRRRDPQDLFARDPAATAVVRRVIRRPPPWWPTATEGLAVLGPRDAVLGTVRALVGEALPVRLVLLHSDDDAAEWSWCRWLTPDTTRLPHEVDGPHLTVVDDTRHWPGLARWWGSRPDEAAALVLVPPGEAPPAWCRWVLRVDRERTATLEAGGDIREVEAPWAPFAWAEAVARTAAAGVAGVGGSGESAEVAPRTEPGYGARDGSTRPRRARLPDRVGLADLVGEPGWSTEAGALRSLATPIGLGPDAAPVHVDLLSDGPHALVAGTTGAGKSELLQSLVLGLALRHPPTALAMVLVDYKGGASFGACRDLPHVVGQVTDLDQAEAARALDGLRAELRRREHLLARAGVGDLEALRARGAAPPRILVVVDEFRALTEDLPDFVPGLVRLAAQGRSLGIHLVLATQRPAGAVNAEMRANIALRLCLRVTEPGDSMDVIEVPDAAHLSPDLPGRAVLRRGPAPPEVVQTAWAALGPTAATGASGVRWAPAWPFEPAEPSDRAEPAEPDDHGVTLVASIRRAAAAAGYGPPDPVWLPPLPERVGEVPHDARPGALPFGLADLPAEQRRSPACWSTSAGPLVVAGRGGSGRTTTLLTLARSALRLGWEVHAVASAGLEGLLSHPRMGTVVGPDDPRRLARLLSLLAAPGGERLLVVDDWGAVVGALDRMPRGGASDLIEPLLRDGRHHGLAVAVAGGPSEVTRLLPSAGERLVLGVADPHEEAVLGVPRELSGGRAVPGRAVHLSADGARRCQVVDGRRVDGREVDDVRQVDGRQVDDVRQVVDGPTTPPLRLLPIPWHVTWDDLGLTPVPGTRDVRRDEARGTSGTSGTSGGGQTPAIGLGGDTADVVRVDVGLGALVVGPPGSGRSTALGTITAGLLADDRRVLVVGRDGPLTAGELVHYLRDDRLPADGDGRGPVLVIDDVDLLAGREHELDELLAALVTAAEAGDPSVPRVVVSARTDRAAAAYRGVLATLRASASVLVLSPAAAGSSDVAAGLAPTVDPTRPTHPGRGTLVHRGRVTCVQVATSSRTRPAG